MSDQASNPALDAAKARHGYVMGLAGWSGSGKTTATLGLLRAMRRAEIGVNAAKSGPDYIDAAFLAAASGASAVNLDSHAMRRDLIRHLAANRPEPRLLVEGVMGLVDGTDGGRGSTVSVAEALQTTHFRSERASFMDGRHVEQLSGSEEPAPPTSNREL